jgi:hypothetical protein
VAGREGPVIGANSYVFCAFATRSCNYMPFRFALSVSLCNSCRTSGWILIKFDIGKFDLESIEQQ